MVWGPFSVRKAVALGRLPLQPDSVVVDVCHCRRFAR